MSVQQVLTKQRVPVNIWRNDVDDQLANIASLPFIHHYVAAMPDVHRGITSGRVTPSASPTMITALQTAK